MVAQEKNEGKEKIDEIGGDARVRELVERELVGGE